MQQISSLNMSPPYCKFKNCSHRKGYSGCKFHKFPAARSRCEKWLRVTQWAASPTKIPAEVFLCSCHFYDQKGPTKDHPDPVEEPEEELCEETVDDVCAQSGPTEDNCDAVQHVDEHHKSMLCPPTQCVVPNLQTELEESHHKSMLCPPTEGVPNLQTELEESTQCSLEFEHLLKNAENERVHEPGVKGDLTKRSVPFSSNEYEDLAIPISDDTLSPSLDSTSEAPPTSAREELSEPIRKRWKSSRDVHEQNQGNDKQLCDAEVQCIRPPFSLDYCISRVLKDGDFQYYTGISIKAFNVLYDFLGGDKVCSKLKYQFAQNTPTRRDRYLEHSPRDKLFITLVRLRRGLTLRDLKLCFHLSVKHLSSIFYTWIRHMSLQFKTIEEDIFVSAAKQAENPPDCYKPFPNLRVVLDCAEFYIQKPENLAQQSNTHSSYKGAATVKVLFGTSTFGGVSFVSEPVEGSMTDRKLFLKSGLMDKLNPGEAVMCDKGFDIEADLEAVGVELLIPAFLGRREHFTARELLVNKAIAGSRIHVEIVIKKVKDFRLIRYTIPNTLLDIVPDMIRVCANLVNFGKSHIRWSHK